MPFKAKIKNLRVYNPAAHDFTCSVTLRVNGADEALSVSLSANAGAGIYYDLSEVIVNKDDLVNWVSVCGSGTAAAKRLVLSFEIEPLV